MMNAIPQEINKALATIDKDKLEITEWGIQSNPGVAKTLILQLIKLNKELTEQLFIEQEKNASLGWQLNPERMGR